MRHVLALALVAATVAGAAAVGSSPAPPAAPPAPGFKVFHHGSIATGNDFREVFLVTEVSPAAALAVAELEIRRDGVPLAVDWVANGTHLRVEDSFSFVQEAFDQKQVLTAHWRGLQVMECRYGGAAGDRIHPDWYRENGMAEKVRCLQLTDDQMLQDGH
jgi:hypothetical protein